MLVFGIHNFCSSLSPSKLPSNFWERDFLIYVHKMCIHRQLTELFACLLSRSATGLLYNRVQRFWLFYIKLRTQTHWWVQILNLRHIYVIRFLIFGDVFQIRLKSFKKCTQKSYKQNKFDEHEWKWKKFIFRHVFAKNFFWYI